MERSRIKIQAQRERRKRRVRARVTGTAERPRLTVFRSHVHMYAQLIDDAAGRTLAAASDRGGAKQLGGSRMKSAEAIGAAIAKKAKELGIAAVVFDRGGLRYHGRIKALADAARAGGLKF